MLDVYLLLGAPDRRVRLLEHRDPKLLLSPEVVVDHPLGGMGLVGDAVDSRSRVAAVGELLGRDLENLAAGPGGVALTSRGRYGRRLRCCHLVLSEVPKIGGRFYVRGCFAMDGNGK